jgi:hypothetical protein
VRDAEVRATQDADFARQVRSAARAYDEAFEDGKQAQSVMLATFAQSVSTAHKNVYGRPLWRKR